VPALRHPRSESSGASHHAKWASALRKVLRRQEARPLCSGASFSGLNCLGFRSLECLTTHSVVLGQICPALTGINAPNRHFLAQTLVVDEHHAIQNSRFA
jgi:hypothetical protein